MSRFCIFNQEEATIVLPWMLNFDSASILQPSFWADFECPISHLKYLARFFLDLPHPVKKFGKLFTLFWSGLMYIFPSYGFLILNIKTIHIICWESNSLKPFCLQAVFFLCSSRKLTYWYVLPQNRGTLNYFFIIFSLLPEWIHVVYGMYDFFTNYSQMAPWFDHSMGQKRVTKLSLELWEKDYWVTLKLMKKNCCK